MPSDLLYRRPDIREAEHQLLAANANIGAARAAFFPSVSLTATGGTTSREFSNLFGAGSATWLFSPHVDIPIFASGLLRSNLEALDASKKIAIANYEKSIQSAFREVADGLAARRGLDERIAATEKLVAAQQKRADLATSRYDKGVDSYFEVLNANLDLYTAKQALIQLRLSRASNAVNLYQALGGGW
jgi:multidrug efflux system outer membrane protein